MKKALLYVTCIFWFFAHPVFAEVKTLNISNNLVNPSVDEGSVSHSAPSLDLKRKEFLYNKAAKFVDDKKYKDAVEQYKKILSFDPRDSNSHIILAKIYQIEEKNPIFSKKEAFFHYYSLLTIAKLDNAPYALEAIKLLESINDNNFVSNGAEKIAEIYPENDKILYNISTMFFVRNMYKDGLFYIKKAIAIDPKNIDYLYNTAVAYDNLSNYNYSSVYYNKFLQGYTKASQSERMKYSSSIKNIINRAKYIKKVANDR